jgi:hypothetical protein
MTPSTPDSYFRRSSFPLQPGHFPSPHEISPATQRFLFFHPNDTCKSQQLLSAPRIPAPGVFDGVNSDRGDSSICPFLEPRNPDNSIQRHSLRLVLLGHIMAKRWPCEIRSFGRIMRLRFQIVPVILPGQGYSSKSAISLPRPRWPCQIREYWSFWSTIWMSGLCPTPRISWADVALVRWECDSMTKT